MPNTAVRAAAEGTPRMNPDLHPNEMPDLYAMICEGTCLEPMIADGTKLLFSSTEKPMPGDLVGIWLDPAFVPPGEHQIIVKRLIVSPGPSYWKPNYINSSGIKPALIVEMLNPAQVLYFDPRHVQGVHKCLGPVQAHHRTVKLDDETFRREHRERVAASAGWSRREALAGTGAALSAALVSVASSVKPAAASTSFATGNAVSQPVRDAMQHYRTAVAEMDAAYAAHDAALAAPNCPPSPIWHDKSMFQGLAFRNVTEARMHTATIIRSQREFASSLSDEAPEKAGIERYVQKVEAARDRAIADLRAMKKAYQPVRDLSDAADRKWSIAYGAFTELLAVPCATLADIKAKIEVFAAAAPAVGSELEYEESKALLLSFAEAR